MLMKSVVAKFVGGYHKPIAFVKVSVYYDITLAMGHVIVAFQIT